MNEDDIKAKHLEFAEKTYHAAFDESKMNAEEITRARAQIPTLGIIPFRAGYQAGYDAARFDYKRLNKRYASAWKAFTHYITDKPDRMLDGIRNLAYTGSMSEKEFIIYNLKKIIKDMENK